MAQKQREKGDFHLAFKVYRIKSSTMWGVQIGVKYHDQDEPEFLAGKEEFKTENEAQIAGRAFLSGMRFVLDKV